MMPSARPHHRGDVGPFDVSRRKRGSVATAKTRRPPTWRPNEGLMRTLMARRATGKGHLGPREILRAKGEFRKRVRRQLEGIPEMILDARRALKADDHSAIFTAMLALLTKLVDGTSAPFDLASDNGQAHRGRGLSGGDVGNGTSHHHGSHGHRHDDDNDDDGVHGNSFNRVRRLDRDAFVALGGPELLIQVLRPPGSPSDARQIPPAIVARDTAVWNVVLVILRELCFTDQDLSERMGSPDLILYLLTLMGYAGVFDHAVGLVEEILAIKSSPYFLGEVPHVHDLISNMTSQQLAHFSRVLALLVFEPEYRQLMESAHVLRSMELLQLRRDRVARAKSVVDRNQALVLSTPNLLSRLMELLQVMNFNPPLEAMEDHTAELEDAPVAHLRISVTGDDQREDMEQQSAATEWAYLADLRAVAGAGGSSANGPATRSNNGAGSSSSSFEQGGQDNSRRRGESSRIANFFRSIFRRSSQRSDFRAQEEFGSNGSSSGSLSTASREHGHGEDGNGLSAAGGVAARVGVEARAGTGAEGRGVHMGVSDLVTFLQPLVHAQQVQIGMLVGSDATAGAAASVASLERALASAGGTMVDGVIPGRGRSRRRLERPTADEARSELQFNGLLLAPHQVEVLFVLCTLLGARRKGEAHVALANLGLIDVLDSMFDRLSWGVAPRQEGPHGAHCECNPESALRVQYLRLVHNFLDRDSNNNPLKRLLLSEHERHLLASGRFMPDPRGSGNVVYVKHGASQSEAQAPRMWRGRAASAVEGQSEDERARWIDTRGLLSKIVDVFIKERTDSLYRFWLASCVEAFLRGGSTQEQLFIAGGGLLHHLVKEITSDGVWYAGSLQTAFDLLGELCKGNRQVLEMLENAMTESQLRRFLKVMVENLVDSNVFMRSLVLSVEHGEVVGSMFKAVGGQSKAEIGDLRGDDPAEDDKKIDAAKNMLNSGEPCYLGHTWFDVKPQAMDLDGQDGSGEEVVAGMYNSRGVASDKRDGDGDGDGDGRSDGSVDECWTSTASTAFAKSNDSVQRRSTGSRPRLTRLQRFLTQNVSQLVRDLMGVITLETINHENICCLNTAVLILIFADRRGQLAEILDCVRNLPSAKQSSEEAEYGDRSDVAMPTGYRSGLDLVGDESASDDDNGGDTKEQEEETRGDASGSQVLESFRRLLWFWGEYYFRVGRDRLSLEFSTHVKFWAWRRVIKLLCADDGSPTALVAAPLRLPRSPYDFAPTSSSTGLPH